jgi:hypothetical protein
MSNPANASRATLAMFRNVMLTLRSISLPEGDP